MRGCGRCVCEWFWFHLPIVPQSCVAPTPIHYLIQGMCRSSIVCTLCAANWLSYSTCSLIWVRCCFACSLWTWACRFVFSTWCAIYVLPQISAATLTRLIYHQQLMRICTPNYTLDFYAALLRNSNSGLRHIFVYCSCFDFGEGR